MVGMRSRQLLELRAMKPLAEGAFLRVIELVDGNGDLPKDVPQFFPDVDVSEAWHIALISISDHGGGPRR